MFQEQNRRIVEIEEERTRLFRQLNSDDKDKINGIYKKFRSSMPTRIDNLRLVQPMISNIEQKLKQIEFYIQNDEKSELFKMRIRERSEYFQQAELLLDAIEEKHFDVVNTGPLRLSLTSLRSGFEVSVGFGKISAQIAKLSSFGLLDTPCRSKNECFIYQFGDLCRAVIQLSDFGIWSQIAKEFFFY